MQNTQDKLVRNEDPHRQANKLKGEGTIEYALWKDGDNNLFIGIIENHLRSKDPGSIPNIFFKIDDYARAAKKWPAFKLPLQGRYEDTPAKRVTLNRDAPGFLKACLRHHLALIDARNRNCADPDATDSVITPETGHSSDTSSSGV